MIKDSEFWEECRGTISEDRIKLIEKELCLNLPKSYLNLLKDCDGGILIKTDFDYYNSYLKDVWSTGIESFLSLNTREKYYDEILGLYKNPPEFFHKNLVAFGGTGGGDYICFDYRQSKDNPNPPIVYWSHEGEEGKDVSFVAKDFEEFLNMLNEPEET